MSRDLKTRQAEMRRRWANDRRFSTEERIKREYRVTPDNKLWQAVEIAAELTGNPALKDALKRASDKLKLGGEKP